MATATVTELDPGELSGVLLFNVSVSGREPKTTVHDFGAESFTTTERGIAWVRPGHWEPIADWLAGFGVVDATALAVFRHPDGQHLLATTQLRRDRERRLVVDHASNRMATDYRVFDLGHDANWPDVLDSDEYRVHGMWL